MVFNSPDQKRTYVQRMFGRIARRYDLLNRLMTFGLDKGLRKEAVRRLDTPLRGKVLDVGAGTGDLAFEISRVNPEAGVVACDLTLEMMLVGKKRSAARGVSWVLADAAHLPFAEGTFDGVISGYLLRNVPEVPAALQEQHRVLTRGCRAVSLDTTPPQKGIFYPLVQFQLKIVIPILGRLIAGDAEAYHYLPNSTEKFYSAETLAGFFEKAGFQAVGFVRRLFGSMAIHWGVKY